METITITFKINDPFVIAIKQGEILVNCLTALKKITETDNKYVLETSNGAMQGTVEIYKKNLV